MTIAPFKISFVLNCVVTSTAAVQNDIVKNKYLAKHRGVYLESLVNVTYTKEKLRFKNLHYVLF